MTESKKDTAKEVVSEIQKDFLSAKKEFADQKRPDGYNKSATIRFLTSKKYTTGDISRTMNIRYQFVRNVQNQPISSK